MLYSLQACHWTRLKFSPWIDGLEKKSWAAAHFTFLHAGGPDFRRDESKMYTQLCVWKPSIQVVNFHCYNVRLCVWMLFHPAPQGATSRGFNIHTVLTNIAVKKWRPEVTSQSDVQSDVLKWRPKVTSISDQVIFFFFFVYVLISAHVKRFSLSRGRFFSNGFCDKPGP